MPPFLLPPSRSLFLGGSPWKFSLMHILDHGIGNFSLMTLCYRCLVRVWARELPFFIIDKEVNLSLRVCRFSDFFSDNAAHFTS